MALTKAEKAMDNFNNEVIAIALEQIDKKELAKAIAKEVTTYIKKDVKNALRRDINIGNLITTQLKSEKTKVGRNFQGLIAEITNDMVDSIRVPNPE